MSEDIKFRPAGASDTGFITSGWLKSYRDSSANWGVTNRVYFSRHHEIVARCVLQGATLVCCMADDPSHILGFINYEILAGERSGEGPRFVCHYLYVKGRFKGNGVAKALLREALELEAREEMTLHYTHRTQNLAQILRDHQEIDKLWEYDPYLQR